MNGIHVKDLIVEYVSDGYIVRAVDDLTFEAERGEIVGLLGPSGCGKTTTLSCLAGILTPTSGAIEVDGIELTAPGVDLTEYRRKHVGIVFQAFNLIPSLTARENVAMPLVAAKVAYRVALARADELLTLVGMKDRIHHKQGALSGGQQQRVAIARALAHDPPMLLADEPTANLDYVQADAIINLLRELRARGRLIIMSTHDDRIVPIADRVVRMLSDETKDGDAPGIVAHSAGAVIFRQGTRGELVYIVEQGEIEIFRELVDGGEEHLALLTAGQYFGELAPLIGFPRSASARARTDVVLRAQTIQEFRRAMLEGMVGAPAKQRLTTGSETSQPERRTDTML